MSGLIANALATDLHMVSPNLHSSWMYLEAVSGRLMAEKRRSETANEMTNMVVAWLRSLGHRERATTVSKLPAKNHGTEISIVWLLI